MSKALFGWIILLLAMPGITGAQDNEHARNVIFVIGDGFGLAQLSLLAYSSEGTVAAEAFPVVGFQKTHSATNLITDSGAAATAMACGVKTYNSAVGMNADSTACKTLMEIAKENGKHTGIVVTSSLVHATPAAFVAHQRLRGFHEQIASQLVALNVDYLVGGGQMYFRNRYSDDRDLVEELEEKGYSVSAYDRRSFAKFARRSDRKMAYFTAHGEPLPKMQGRENLADIVSHALSTLSSQDDAGFFLVIEGSQIDYANHANDYGYLLTELRDLEGAVRVALAFALEHPDTLIVFTGDHESGSLALRPSHLQKKVHVEFLSRNHSETMVPVFAIGPGANLFAGIYENTEIFSKICTAAGFGGWMH